MEANNWSDVNASQKLVGHYLRVNNPQESLVHFVACFKSTHSGLHGRSYLPARGVLSVDDWLGVRPFVYGEDIFRGVDDPNPTGVGGSTGRRIGVPLLLTRPGMPPPDLMLDDLRTELPRGPDSSEFRERLEPAGGRFDVTVSVCGEYFAIFSFKKRAQLITWIYNPLYVSNCITLFLTF
jgi:hypothetical protein